RAVLIAVICRYVPSVGVGILIAALLFAAGHWSQGIVGTGAIVMFGVLYGYAYCLTRSIMLPILAHYIHNLFIFAP
ncbi:MAG: CPBP family intramembrane glutamic endopeptidase, partial [Rhodospirillales bacterium]